MLIIGLENTIFRAFELPDHKCYRTLKNSRALPDI